MWEKYPSPEGFEAPILNPEIAAKMTESQLKRDDHMVKRQQLGGAALAALGSAMKVVSEADDNTIIDKVEHIGKLNEAAKLVNLFIFDETVSRKAFILPGVDKKYKTLLEKCRTEKFLFGENLSEKIKEMKEMDRIGENLKGQASSQYRKPPPSYTKASLNFRGQQHKKPPYAQPNGPSQSGQNRPKLSFKPKQQPFNHRAGNQARFKPRAQIRFK